MIREVWKIKQAGNLENLQKETEKLKNIEEYHSPIARIKVKAIGLNFADIFSISTFIYQQMQGDQERIERKGEQLMSKCKNRKFY